MTPFDLITLLAGVEAAALTALIYLDWKDERDAELVTEKVFWREQRAGLAYWPDLQEGGV